MTVTVGIVSNPLDPSAWEEFTCDDPRALLKRHFGTWPDSARIFDLEGVGDWTRAAALIDAQALAARDVTPRDSAGVERLGQLRGPLLVTIPPADPLTAIIAVVAIAVGVAAAFLFMPKLPDAQRAQSPNNALAARENRARPNGRIPDIFGTVESTPDLLVVPYSVFENDREVEVSYMCVGRGSYAVTRVRDGDTSLASIAGSSASIYAPFTSPNSGDAPQLQIGAPISEPIETVIKLNEVNGQTLQPTNLNRVQGENSIRFVYPDSIEINDTDVDFTEFFAAGNAISVTGANLDGSVGTQGTTQDARFTEAGVIEFDTFDPSTLFADGQTLTIANGGYAGDNGSGGVLFVDLSGTYLIASVGPTSITLSDPAADNSDWDRLGDYPADRTEYRSASFSVPLAGEGINLNGNYTLLSVSSTTLVLNNPALVNASWNDLDDLPGGATDYVSPNISRSSDVWAGSFIVDLVDNQRVLANVVGMNGLYTISKSKGRQAALSVGFELEVTPVNSADSAIGPAELFPATITGSQKERTTVGYSLFAEPSFSGRASVRMRRTTPSPDTEDFSAIVDEIKWRDCYGIAPIDQTEFGDVTTVHTRTIATAGALSLKSRKLNMRVTRKLPARISGSTFGPLAATDSADDIIAAMALDPLIGRRAPSEVDFDNIYDTIAAVKAYFGSSLAGQFGYTFDDDDVSFEETLQTVAQAVFCRGYRQGRVIRISFERATEDSSLIFNARNILPGSQKRTVRFGPLDDHDGVELDYTDPLDGAQLTYAIPTDRTALSPRSIEIVGVRSYLLAYWQAWRAWNKVRYQNIAVELEATQEAGLVIPQDRILIADLTRPDVLAGEVESEAGTTIDLSQPAVLDPARFWTIFLQHIDGTVEALGVTQGADDYQVILSAAPRAPLSLDAENFARATYMIVPDDDVQARAFLATEREPQSNFTETLRAVNYSFLYYQHDQLSLWLDFGPTAFMDSGPFFRDGAAVGSATLVADAERGGRQVYSATGTDAGISLPSGFLSPTNYTKAAWVKLAPGAAGGILNSVTDVEYFGMLDGNLTIVHQGFGGGVSVDPPAANEWHHVAGTFDAGSGTMAVYIDGLRQGSSTSNTRGPIAAMAVLDGIACRADDLRIWRRALTDAEIRSVYLARKVAG